MRLGRRDVHVRQLQQVRRAVLVYTIAFMCIVICSTASGLETQRHRESIRHAVPLRAFTPV
jgi:hypothetical protein